MDSLDEILKALYEAKISVEDIIQEIFKNPIKLADPIIISAKRIEDILNNSELSIKEVELLLSFLPIIPIEIGEEKKEIEIIDWDIVNVVKKDLKSYFSEKGIKFSYEEKKCGYTPVNYPKICNSLVLNLNFHDGWKCDYKDLYEFYSFIKNENERIFVEKNKYGEFSKKGSLTINFIKGDENFERSLDDNLKKIFIREYDPIQLFTRFVFIKIIYNKDERKFIVRPWANAESGYIFILEKLRRLNRYQIFQLGLHEFLHAIGESIFSQYEEKIEKINNIILERVREFCRMYNLEMKEKENRGIEIYLPQDLSIEVKITYSCCFSASDFNLTYPYYITVSGGFNLTLEAVIELETIRLIEEKYKLSSNFLKELRIAEIKELESNEFIIPEISRKIRQLVIYAGYLTAHEIFEKKIFK